MVNANIDIFEMSYEESVSYFKRLENLEKIGCTNGPNPTSLPIGSKKRVSVTSSVVKSSKNHKEYNMWCHYCDKKNHNTDDCRAITKLNSIKRLALKPNLYPKRRIWSFLFIFEGFNALKRQLKPEKTASSKKRKA
jgi:hypothetical protein